VQLLMNFKHIVVRPETLNHSSVQKQDGVTQFRLPSLSTFRASGEQGSNDLVARECNKPHAAWCMLTRDLMTCYDYENKLALEF
jgi:hypothetical protein